MNFNVIETKRKQLRYTVSDFCKEAGIDRRTYYNIKENPNSATIKTLNQMIKVLNLTQAEMKQLLA